MSARYGSLSGVSNHYGTTGLGVLGSVIRATTGTGAHGSGYLYNDWTPGDDAKEFRGLIVTPPASGTFIAYEDGSFELSGAADGAYSFVYRLYVDGVDLGLTTSTVTVGTVVAITGTAAGIGAVFGLGSVTGSVSVDIIVTGTAAGTGAIVGTGTVFGVVTDVVVSNEPVTVSEAIFSARLEDGDPFLDSLVSSLITAAREQAEHITGKTYVDTTRRVDLTDWPAVTDVLYVQGTRSVAITYWDGTGWVALASNQFAWTPYEGGTAIAPEVGVEWPTLGEVAIGPRVRIDFTAGPTDPRTAPEQVKLYIKALVAVWMRNPEAAQARRLETSPLFDRLLDSERLWH